MEAGMRDCIQVSAHNSHWSGRSEQKLDVGKHACNCPTHPFVTTRLLQIGAKHGLTLYDIGPNAAVIMHSMQQSNIASFTLIAHRRRRHSGSDRHHDDMQSNSKKLWGVLLKR
eukprot:3766620-Amphidinium_carterae.1